MTEHRDRLCVKVPLCCIAVVSMSCGLSAAEPPADLILHHGRIVTVDAQFTIAEALAVRGDRIVAVGANDNVLTFAGADTTVIDLAGKMVVPGLMDSHVHPAGAAVYEFDHPIPPMETIADVLAYVAARADVLDDGQWIVIQQVFVTRLRDQRFPTRRELDAAAPNNPVVFRTGPDAAVNSLALQLSGIDENFQIPDGEAGQIERDPQTGELTGMIRSATRFIKQEPSDRKPTFDEQRAQLQTLLADYNSVGITTISDRGASQQDLALYESLKASGDLTCRTFVCRMVDPNRPWDEVKQEILEAAQHPAHQYDSLLWLRGIKSFLDGGMLTGSAYMQQPWGVSRIYSITDPEYRGVRQIDAERLYETARLCLENDLQFTAHSVGDGAVHALIEAYRQIDEHDFPVKPHRPCITHCNFMSAEAIDEMAQRGIVADLQPIWLLQDGRTLRDHFGDERLTWFQPYHTLFEKGVIVGGGSDHMQRIGSLRSVNPYNPWLGMWIALVRRPRGVDGALHPEQSITREQALRLYTTSNA
ncbi:MAG: amidohydrolase, partial [Planctomycetaceae bacterium]|nr:amidohydrolase [Planctomycetaceae bacterium]